METKNPKQNRIKKGREKHRMANSSERTGRIATTRTPNSWGRPMRSPCVIPMVCFSILHNERRLGDSQGFPIKRADAIYHLWRPKSQRHNVIWASMVAYQHQGQFQFQHGLWWGSTGKYGFLRGFYGLAWVGFPCCFFSYCFHFSFLKFYFYFSDYVHFLFYLFFFFLFFSFPFYKLYVT